MGESHGKTTLFDFFQDKELTVLIFGLALVLIAIAIPKLELCDEKEGCE